MFQDSIHEAGKEMMEALFAGIELQVAHKYQAIDRALPGCRWNIVLGVNENLLPNATQYCNS